MTNIHTAPALDWRSELARARTHRDHGSEEFLTAVARIAESIPQTEIAVQLQASQPQVSRWAAKGRSLLELVDGGKLGRSPYHVAERYSRGEITRDQVIDALAHWEYVAGETTTRGLDDDLLNYVSGSFDDVEAALLDELIDGEIYAAALNGLKAQLMAARQTSGG
ncbi:hypothetical protein [Marisediminicola senii]|uniref:hypothetical protein n=1 Tax=Marisediminicola senii TaxID=2711233 RepID=UPI0013EB1F61|nr:hypothetical protein [Marisediminicola senii]